MKFIDTKFLKVIIIFLLSVVALSSLYVMIEYRTFTGPGFTHTINGDFTYLEGFFQEEPEELLTGATSSIPEVKVPIIIYHSVRPYIPGESILQDRFDITPQLFEQQLQYLKAHGFTTIGPDELARDIRLGTTTPTVKPVMLSFDDGWENQYKYAYPLLKKYQMTATFYVYSNPINRNRPSYLSWDQLREMSSEGMTIGSHSLSHPLFRNSTAAQIKNEIFDSKKIIESQIGKPVLSFAQPFGYTSPGIEAFIKEAGYKTSRGTFKGVYHSRADLYDLQGYFTSDNFNDFVYILSR